MSTGDEHNGDAGEDEEPAGGRGWWPPAGGRDPEVAFPLSIASVALGVVGLTAPLLAWVATGLAVIAYLFNAAHAPTRTFAIVGAVFGLVGIGASLVG